MELVQKGQEAALGGIKQFMVKLSWTTAADFDLAAAYETKTGEKGMIYFGALGSLNEMPFMQLSGDAGIGDTGGDNEEIMRVMKLDDLAKVHIVCWDYEMVKVGQHARFSDSDVKLSLTDDTGVSHDVKLDTGDMANVAVVATIDNTGMMGAKFINESKVGTLKDLHDSEQLFEIANQ